VATSVDPVLAYLVDELAALGGFGVAVELTVVVGSLVIVGTPIADSEYFAHLGEWFRQTVEPSFRELSFHHGKEASRELEHGLQEDQLLQLAPDREQGYRLFGEDVQQSVRERVQGRPEQLREYPRDEDKEQALRVRLAKSLSDDAAPHRRFLHLQDASILAGGTLIGSLPYWRVRLSDVSAWNLGRPEARGG
jgi:hypothetical protein